MTVTRPARTIDDGVATSFRTAMAGLAAGVCVVTSCAPDGAPVGTTVSTGFSVSMSPPLFGVCFDTGSRTLPTVIARGAFVGNVLAGEAQDVARRFASREPDKFRGIAHRYTADGLPWLIKDAVSAVECEVVGATEIGDHVLVLGAVSGVHRVRDESATSLAYVDRRFFSLPRGTTD
ncbi:flavin reductase family protein [Georgenia sp. Z1491]|uniref:flavin reductase family protein n=1 Tax=Georgenia sp. Z1491 TaxID=3416707 RepID=UPI003CED4732